MFTSFFFFVRESKCACTHRAKHGYIMFMSFFFFVRESMCACEHMCVHT